MRRLVARPVAVKSTVALPCGCASETSASLSWKVHGGIDARAGLASARFRAAPQPFDLALDEIGERILLAFLRLQKFGALLQKLTVIARRGEQAERISAVDFDHAGRGVFEKVAVVRYKN